MERASDTVVSILLGDAVKKCRPQTFFKEDGHPFAETIMESAEFEIIPWE